MNTEEYKERKRNWAKTEAQKEYRRNYMRIWREKNREQHNKLARESHQRNAHKHVEKIKRKRLVKIYGITEEQYQEILKDQNNSCKICSSNIEVVSRKRLHIDHCHKTNMIRGLLCSRCNGALGWYEKYKNNIIDYLKNNLQISIIKNS
jgi:hypothetical protein